MTCLILMVGSLKKKKKIISAEMHKCCFSCSQTLVSQNYYQTKKKRKIKISLVKFSFHCENTRRLGIQFLFLRAITTLPSKVSGFPPGFSGFLYNVRPHPRIQVPWLSVLSKKNKWATTRENVPSDKSLTIRETRLIR